MQIMKDTTNKDFSNDRNSTCFKAQLTFFFQTKVQVDIWLKL